MFRKNLVKTQLHENPENPENPELTSTHRGSLHMSQRQLK